MDAKKDQTFRIRPSPELVHQLVTAFGLYSLDDSREFSRDDMENIGTIDAVNQMIPQLSPLYIPCKARWYLTNLGLKNCITILRQVVRTQGRHLKSREVNRAKRKVVLYKIERGPFLNETKMDANENCDETKMETKTEPKTKTKTEPKAKTELTTSIGELPTKKSSKVKKTPIPKKKKLPTGQQKNQVAGKKKTNSSKDDAIEDEEHSHVLKDVILQNAKENFDNESRGSIDYDGIFDGSNGDNSGVDNGSFNNGQEDNGEFDNGQEENEQWENDENDNSEFDDGEFDNDENEYNNNDEFNINYNNNYNNYNNNYNNNDDDEFDWLPKKMMNSRLESALERMQRGF